MSEATEELVHNLLNYGDAFVRSWYAESPELTHIVGFLLKPQKVPFAPPASIPPGAKIMNVVFGNGAATPKEIRKLHPKLCAIWNRADEAFSASNLPFSTADLLLVVLPHVAGAEELVARAASKYEAWGYVRGADAWFPAEGHPDAVDVVALVADVAGATPKMRVMKLIKSADGQIDFDYIREGLRDAPAAGRA